MFADVWIMRFSTEARAGYWGINNINDTEADHILSQLKVRLPIPKPSPASRDHSVKTDWPALVAGQQAMFSRSGMMTGSSC